MDHEPETKTTRPTLPEFVQTNLKGATCALWPVSPL
jgi:hypothetical protein